MNTPAFRTSIPNTLLLSLTLDFSTPDCHKQNILKKEKEVQNHFSIELFQIAFLNFVKS